MTERDLKLAVKRILARCRLDENGCLVWTGALSSGYGVMRTDKVLYRVHRLIYAHYAFGSLHDLVSTGLHVLHHCDNRKCVNPEHLWLGSDHDNMWDKVAKGRSNSVRGEHCGRAKLKAEDVISIRRQYIPDSGSHGGPALARKFGVSQRQVYKIIKNKSWSHL